jgi:hypothetical protein
VLLIVGGGFGLAFFLIAFAGGGFVAASAARGFRLGFDGGDGGAHLDGLAFFDEVLFEHARRRGRDFRVHLVGANLQQGLVHVDLVAGLLVPGDYGALGDRLAHLGHFDLLFRHDGRWADSSEDKKARAASKIGHARRERKVRSAVDPAGI